MHLHFVSVCMYACARAYACMLHIDTAGCFVTMWTSCLDTLYFFFVINIWHFLAQKTAQILWKDSLQVHMFTKDIKMRNLIIW